MAATSIDNAIMERITFLRELITPDNKQEVNETFQLQIEILQSADISKVDNSILMRKYHLRQTKDIRETDRLYAELEALEWLQRQLAGARC